MFTKVYADTMFSSQKSVHGNTCAEIFMTSEGLVNGMVMKTNGEAYLALEKFCKEDGIPNLLVTDMEKKEMYGEWVYIVKQNHVAESACARGLGHG